ncbi:MAG TPA: hypothetical protein VMK83_10990 [Gaiellaceae bacterium]|nr:hypothetical protein [Gaiellaceae bacterium]
MTPSAILETVPAPHPARHLLRAKDLVDARYREPLDVKTLARAAKLRRRSWADTLLGLVAAL